MLKHDYVYPRIIVIDWGNITLPFTLKKHTTGT